jgi:hypothetical protein
MGCPSSTFQRYRNKVIVYSQLGDFLFPEYINALSKIDNHFIVLTSHDITPHTESPNIEIIRLKSAYAEYVKYIPQDNIDFNLIKSESKTKHFLSLNNRASWYRQALFYFFENFQLHDKAHFSYVGDLSRTNYANVSDVEKDFFDQDIWYLNQVNSTEIKKKIPKYTGIEIPKDVDWGVGDATYYRDCFCSIVTETYAAENSPFFTEKIFKPILFFQPFLLHANKGSLTVLKNLGFMTFDRWWDENYDELPNGTKRFEAMLRVILEISQWSINKINQVYQEMLPVLEHNHNHFTNVLPSMYNIEIAQVTEKIKQRLQE